VIAKYTGVLAAADVFTASTTFWVMESLRLDLGFASWVHRERSNDSHHGRDRPSGWRGRAGSQEQRIPFARHDAQAGERAGRGAGGATASTSSRAISMTRRRCAVRWPAAWGVFGVQNTWEAGVEREEAQGKRLATLAREAGVEHYVYTSVGSAHKRTGVRTSTTSGASRNTVRGLRFPSHGDPASGGLAMENLLAPFSLQGTR